MVHEELIKIGNEIEASIEKWASSIDYRFPVSYFVCMRRIKKLEEARAKLIQANLKILEVESLIEEGN